MKLSNSGDTFEKKDSITLGIGSCGGREVWMCLKTRRLSFTIHFPSSPRVFFPLHTP